MDEKKAKYASLRHESRKYPKITITYDDESSKSITVHADIEVAKDLLREIKQQIKLSVFDIDDYINITSDTLLMLKDFRERYIEHRKKLLKIGHISKATLNQDQFALDIFVKKIGKNNRLAKLKADDVINFLVIMKDSNNKTGKPYKPGAINSYMKHIKSAFSWALKEGFIIKNPWQDVGQLHNPNEGAYRFISEEDIERIRIFLKNKPEWQIDIFNFCLWTGARRNEAFNLKSTDLYIDVFKGEKAPFARLLGKGRKSRNMPLCPEACELLDRRVKYLTDPVKQLEIKDRSQSPTQHSGGVDSRLKQGYLFWEILDSNSITRAFSRVKSELGLDYFNVHSLRHSFATYCIKDDIRVTTVKEFLGHTNIKTTMIYAKTDDELKAKDIKKMKPR